MEKFLGIALYPFIADGKAEIVAPVVTLQADQGDQEDDDGHAVHFAQPEDVDGRGRILRISGWYQTDNPTMV